MFFLRNKKNKLKKGDIYAVHKGTYLGHLLVFIEHNTETDTYNFLSTNNLQNFYIPSKDVEEGIESNLLRKTNAVLSGKVLNICIKQYKFNIDHPKNTNILKEDENTDTGL